MNNSFDKIRIYCNSLTKYSRYKTREVFIGEIPLGGSNPIRIQSMTTTDTMDTTATVEQTIRMVDAGCDYVRITAPSILEAENLLNIKNELGRRGYKVPLIADIHYTPNAAEKAARIVEKVRINPGNYADKKKFQNIDYTDAEYDLELERIRQKFTPLVKICKEYGTAMRIGTNHGSLSDRIMSRYGDSPLGMVESALEFLRICEDESYHNIVLSMKSSNPKVMIQAYRLLIQKMEDENMYYPLHLGVTEAGGGEDGRIKSAVGIGTLLEDGIGDTVRVSLTEDPEFEAPVAISLVSRYKIPETPRDIKPLEILPYNPYDYTKRRSNEISGIGGANVPKVAADFSSRKSLSVDDLSDIGYFYDAASDKWKMNDTAADLIFLGDIIPEFELPSGLLTVYNYPTWKNNRTGSFPLITAKEYRNNYEFSTEIKFFLLRSEDLDENLLTKLKFEENAVIILESRHFYSIMEQRRAFCELLQQNITNPVIIKRNYTQITLDEFRLSSSIDFGSLLIEGFGDGVWANCSFTKEKVPDNVHIKSFLQKEVSSEKIINRILFGILQAARTRISKTEYIACPSCGRTLFDLKETTEIIRKRTEHLKGLKIAIMGCIVNGPGEMADADYGYVGSGTDKITLYKGKDVVKRNIPADNAVNTLIKIIRENNDWQEPNL
ncbi:MAG: (E)-4-hydroxy-3-methylbut-2-enyl-diphosphate synthase [Ignavibacteriaceae bacterium]|nr:(E)-4-hydroxy-3-methylbut-2-enyl-diphosphate synthase [Ignavibacteriaceae bacterium]